MDYPLENILKASSSIQVALIRFMTKEGQQNLHARIVVDSGNVIHCLIDGEIPRGIKTGHAKIHLIQKKHDNYFFISGHVAEKAHKSPGVFSIIVTRAFWFERKRRGGVAWLREKYRYEKEKMKLAS